MMVFLGILIVLMEVADSKSVLAIQLITSSGFILGLFVSLRCKLPGFAIDIHSHPGSLKQLAWEIVPVPNILGLFIVRQTDALSATSVALKSINKRYEEI